MRRIVGRDARPARLLPHEHAPADQAPDNLLDEQRIAAPLEEAMKSCSPRHLGRARRRATYERARLGAGERSETDDRLRGAGDARWARVGPVGDEQHQRAARQLIGHVAQQIHRRSVGPVEILDKDEQRLALEPPLDEGAGGQGDLVLELLGLDVGVHRILEPEHVAQDRGDRRRLLVPRPERPEAGGELLPGDVQ